MNDLAVLRPFHSISVILGLQEGDYEGLCAMQQFWVQTESCCRT